MAELRAADCDPERIAMMDEAISKMVYFDSYIVLDTITSVAKEKIIEGNKAIMQMSTPVTAIWEGILLLPLVGIIDSRRAQDTRGLNSMFGIDEALDWFALQKKL